MDEIRPKITVERHGEEVTLTFSFPTIYGAMLFFDKTIAELRAGRLDVSLQGTTPSTPE